MSKLLYFLFLIYPHYFLINIEYLLFLSYFIILYAVGNLIFKIPAASFIFNFGKAFNKYIREFDNLFLKENFNTFYLSLNYFKGSGYITRCY